MQTELVRIFVLTAASFVVAISFAPFVASLLYRWHFKKNIRESARTPLYTKMHRKKSGTPTMGGIVVWGTVYIFAIGLFLTAYFFPEQSYLRDLNFLTRRETFLPFASLMASAFVGLIDDIFNVFRLGDEGGGLRVRHRLFIYMAIAGVGAWWFHFKLQWDVLHIPFAGDVTIGWAYVIFFIVVLVATSFSVNETDGLDGLAGGTLGIAFGAYAVIAFMQGRFDLAAFCAVIAGALVAYLWFNIPPARFIMGDTGSMSLGITLGVVAMLTNQALLLPFIGFVFVVESASVIVQIFCRKVFATKFFLSTPIHHHFEAIGWAESKVVMRFWIIAVMMAVIGVIIAFVEPHSTLTGFTF